MRTMTNGSVWYAGMAVVLVAISGCAAIRPSEKAKQLNFREIYADSVKTKYAYGGLDATFKKYDELQQSKGQAEAFLRAQDEDKRAKLTQSAAQLSQEISARQAEIDLLKAQIADAQTKVISLEKQKADLGKKTGDASTATKIAAIETQIDGLRQRGNVASSGLTRMASDLESAKAGRQAALDLAVELKNKTYPAIEDQCKQMRSAFVYDLLALADSNYLNFKDSLLEGRAGYDTVLDITELMLSSATTLVGGLTARGNLGASSTLLKGSRSSVDKNFFAQQTLASILNAIEDQQQKDKVEILKGLTKSTTDYPLTQAFSDVQNYESRASLVAGALLVANQTASTAKKSKDELDEVKKDPAKAISAAPAAAGTGGK